MSLIPWAHELARQLLAEPLPRRWAHTQGVARKAESVAHIVGTNAELLICSAWLHDIGYAPAIVSTGFHPIDGARYLRDVHVASNDLCQLVAHHTYSVIEARNRGLSEKLVAEFPPIAGDIIDALTYCDITTSPDGQPVTLQIRVNEIIDRYGEKDVVSKSIEEARPHLERATRKVISRLSTHPKPLP